MQPSREQLLKINATLRLFPNYSDWFEGRIDNWIFSDERIAEITSNQEEINTIEIDFPGEHEDTRVELSELLDLQDEINSIKIIDEGYIKTNSRSYYIVGADDDYQLKEFVAIEGIVFENVKVNLINKSIVVGLAASKLEQYDSDFWSTYSQYLAIELIYPDAESVLNKEREMEILNSYIFEVADSTGIALYFSEIHNPVDDFEEEEQSSISSALRELEPFNEGMKLFISAVQIKDPELQFLNFYKVLEHFSPIAVNIEANELMRKKLDAPRSVFAEGDFIRSIFELANSTRDRFNDEDLIKASFNTCFDFVGLYRKLPESIQKRIKKQIGNDLSYSSDKQTISTASNMASKIIYKTRNKVVHAKSNFTPTGDEIQLEEFTALNSFMKEASSQAIRWYNRQPSHLKLQIIK